MQTDVRYVIYSEKTGFFLGISNGALVFEKYGLFYSNKIPSLELEEAKKFSEKLRHYDLESSFELLPVKVTSPDLYASMVDLIKSGHSDKTEYMLSSLPAEETIH